MCLNQLKSVFWTLLLSTAVFADQYHYKDTLIGERAAGLGGAYVAISDDPSGIYYNPAGIIFGLENYLSVSANGYSIAEQKYKDLYPGQDYTYRSQSLIPALFGFTQTFRKSKIGFAVMVPNSDLIDQTDQVNRQATSTAIGLTFRRKFFRQDSTYLFGPAYATEIFENCSFGISILGLMRIIKIIDNTLVQFDPVGTGQYYTYMSYINRTHYGTVVKLGLQYMPMPKLSLGVMLEQPFNITSSGQGSRTVTNVGGNGLPVTPTGKIDNDLTNQEFTDEPKIPTLLSGSLGVAYFFTKQFLITGQLDLFNSELTHSDFAIDKTFNWALGSEYYLSEVYAIRAGVYSNNSKTQPLNPDSTNQPPFVNELGLSVAASMYRAGTSLTLTASYLMGSGEGQAFADSKTIQTVTVSNIAVYVSGSYQL